MADRVFTLYDADNGFLAVIRNPDEYRPAVLELSSFAKSTPQPIRFGDLLIE